MTHLLLINSDKPEPIRFFKEYNKHHDIRLTVLTRSRYASIYNSFADEIYEVEDISDLSQARLLMLDILKHEPVDYIITPTEKSVLTGGFLRSYFAIPGPSFETTLYMTNKLAMKTKLHQAGIPVTNFIRLDCLEDIPQAAEKLGWPLIVKPAMGSGTLDTFCIDSPQAYLSLYKSEALRSLKEHKVPMLAEKYVEMEEYHCDGLIHNGQLLFVSISKYFSPPLKARGRLLGSYIIHEENPMHEKILAIYKSVVKTFGVTDGPTHMEIYHTSSGELLVGEIALRVGGGGISDTIFKKYGVSMWDASFLIAMNQDPQLQPVRSQGIFGWCGLPCRNGTIKDFTPVEELQAIPQVLDVQMHYKRGDRVQEKEISTFHLGKVYFRLEREDQLTEFLSLIHEKFYLQIEEDLPIAYVACHAPKHVEICRNRES